MRKADIISFIFAVMAFSLITNWPWKQLEDRWRRRVHRSEHRKPLHHRVWQVFVVIATILGAFGGLDYFYGHPWPSDPEIHPHDTIVDSSLVLPFTVKDTSAFEMKSVEFRCGIDLIWAEDAKNQQVVIRDVAFKEGVYAIPARSPPINYPCNATELLKIRPDGTLSLYGSSTTLESKTPRIYTAPWHVRKMCVWVGGEYKFSGLHQTFTSAIFQWPATPGLHQWIEGPIVREPPKEEQISGWYKDALQCSPNVFFPTLSLTGQGAHT